MLVRRLANSLCVVVLALAASSCATNPWSVNACDIEKRVEISGAEFESSIKYLGPPVRSAGWRSSIDDIHFARLYAERSRRTNNVNYFVKIEIKYAKGWRYYRRAIFADSSKTAVDTQWFAEDSCSGEGCLKVYALQVPVTFERLISEPQLRFKLESITGESNVFTIPRHHIEGFIQATGGVVDNSCAR